LVLRVLLVHKEVLERLALLVLMVHLVLLGLRDLSVNWALLGLQVQMEQLDCQEIRELLDGLV
jgi:hypothetical protein